MISPAARIANPFTTRYTRPGSLVPRDRCGEPLDVVSLAVRARSGRATAIVGPHGAGKTNLLRGLARQFSDQGLLAATVRARSPRDAAGICQAVLAAQPGTVLCIDSWDILGRAGAGLVRRLAGWRGVVLLATCHRATGLPILVRCETSAILLARLVADLPDHGGLIDPTDIAAAFAAHDGDIREALYDLYDRFERRMRRP